MRIDSQNESHTVAARTYTFIASRYHNLYEHVTSRFIAHRNVQNIDSQKIETIVKGKSTAIYSENTIKPK